MTSSKIKHSRNESTGQSAEPFWGSTTPSTNFHRSGKVVLLLAAAVLAGCTQIKHLPAEADVALPQQWEVQIPDRDLGSQGEAESADKNTEAMPDLGAVNSGWLSTFADEELNSYVQKALTKNPDLLGSAAQLKSAIERVTIDGSNLWPSAGASVDKTAIDTETDGITTEIRTVSASLDISWEADVWGKLTQRKRAAAYDAKAQAELFKSAELSLVANVSRAWYNLVTNKLQLDLAHQRLDSFERTAGLIDENYKRGLRSALDVYLSRTDVQVQVSALADSQFNYIKSLRTFKTLLGEYPDSSLEFEANLPVINDPVPVGLPAELLTRRPDIRASQLRYQAQIANAKAANRDRYPSITFVGSIGDSRDKFDQLFDGDNMMMTLISGIAQPIFRAGALKARAQSAAYQAEASYASLVKTTLTAFQEVEDSLSREQALQMQHAAIKEAVKYAQGGLDLALDRYQSGIENYTTVLESQRRLFDSMRNEINIRNALLQNRIGIHLALGGDFTNMPDRDLIESLPSVATSGSNP